MKKRFSLLASTFAVLAACQAQNHPHGSVDRDFYGTSPAVASSAAAEFSRFVESGLIPSRTVFSFVMEGEDPPEIPSEPQQVSQSASKYDFGVYLRDFLRKDGYSIASRRNAKDGMIPVTWWIVPFPASPKSADPRKDAPPAERILVKVLVGNVMFCGSYQVSPDGLRLIPISPISKGIWQ